MMTTRPDRPTVAPNRSAPALREQPGARPPPKRSDVNERTGAASTTGFTPVEVRYTIPGQVQTLRRIRTQKALDYQRQFCARQGIEIHERELTADDLAVERRGKRGAWIAIGVVAAVITVASIAAGSGSDSESSDASPGLAFVMCKDFVKDRLKAPATATFRNFYDDDGEVSVTGSGDGPYRVVSTVDSENGFGAKIRSRFSCTVTHTPGGDNWRLDAISVN